MLGQAGVDSQAGRSAEIIPQLERKGEQGEEVGCHRKKGEQTVFLRGDGGKSFPSGIKYRSKTGDENQVGRKSFVEQELRGGQREGEQAHGGDRKQKITGATQARERGAETRPRSEERRVGKECRSGR